MRTNHYGLLLVMMEPPEEMEEEFNEWYDTEHIPERKAVPGIFSAERFVAFEGSPRYLALYDLESVEVLQSESYKKIGIDHLSPWSKRIIRSVRGFKRNIYQQTFPGTAQIPEKADALALWAYDIEANKEDELNRWYNTDCFFQLKKMEGFIDVRRFICVEGSPKHLALLNFKDVRCFENEAYRKVLLFGETIPFKKYLNGTIHKVYKKYIERQTRVD